MERDQATFALLTFNQEQFVSEAVYSALSQTYEPLEIIISDDCSTDATFEIIQNIVAGYDGNHSVKTFKNQNNIGITAHVNKVFRQANGSLVILAAGDDISDKNRVIENVKIWKRTGVSAIISNARTIDKDGHLLKNTVRYNTDKVLKYNRQKVCIPSAFGAGSAYEREIFSKFGEIPPVLRNEDSNLIFKAYLGKGIYYSEKILLSYRVHGRNATHALRIKDKTKISLRSALTKEANLNRAENLKEFSRLLKRYQHTNMKTFFTIKHEVLISTLKGRFSYTYEILRTIKKITHLIKNREIQSRK